MMNFPVNDRIRLRAPEPEDLDQLYAWENDASLWRRSNTVSPYSRYAIREYIAQAHLNIYEAKQMRLMIEERISPAPVGVADLYDFDLHNRKVATGILIDASRRQKGIATQTLTLLTEYVFAFLKLHQIYAYIPADNEASKRLFLRCGFHPTSLLKEWIRVEGGYSDVLLVQQINPCTPWKTI
ncbi:MAG: GNAT family N-acetyltransferase [Tannerellaceae bacterium]|jgi:diamine N-acetyltransferase|nr:GNAT family N-acetyltransferase [Tannerellaceae bacterium]